MCTLCKLTFILLENGRSQFSCHSRRFPCLSVQELFIRIASTLRYPHSFRRSLSLFRARRNASISHSFNPLCNLILHGDNLTPYSSLLPFFPLFPSPPRTPSPEPGPSRAALSNAILSPQTKNLISGSRQPVLRLSKIPALPASGTAGPDLLAGILSSQKQLMARADEITIGKRSAMKGRVHIGVI